VFLYIPLRGGIRLTDNFLKQAGSSAGLPVLLRRRPKLTGTASYLHKCENLL
jgi:hypothetical protein